MGLDLFAMLPSRHSRLTQEHLEAIRYHFQHGSLFNTGALLWAVAILALLLALLWTWRYFQQERSGHWLLWEFHRLAQHLGLSLGQQWLLWCIARHQGLPSPLTLLLSPATLQHHAERYAQDRPENRQQVLDAAAAIQRLLFGA